MAREIFVFLPPPTESGVLQEMHPYGPAPVEQAFHTDLSVEINPANLEDFPAVAITSGYVRAIPIPNGSTSPSTVDLVLRPAPAAMKDLHHVFGGETVVFVYRNLDPQRVASDLTTRIETMLSIDSSEIGTPTESNFLLGEFPVYVHAGDELMLPSPIGGTGDWGRLGFEIVLLPSGLGKNALWPKLVERVDAASLTRRMDPLSFYQRVVNASEVELVEEHIDHALFTIATKRSLLELRNEYDLPFEGTLELEISTGGSTETQTVALAPELRSTIVLEPTVSEYKVKVPNYVLTELPSGTEALQTQEHTLTAPAHRSMQALFMANWFAKNDDSTMAWYTENNLVTPLIDGVEMFYDLYRNLQKITKPEHFVCFANWKFDHTVPLLNFSTEIGVLSGRDTSIKALAIKIADKNAKVYGLLWDHFASFPFLTWQELLENLDAVRYINKLPNDSGSAIHDSETLLVGSHHQKLTIINGDNGTIGYCGGIDISPNRLDSRPSHQAEEPYHDTHARIKGSAVADLYKTFVERWNGHPETTIESTIDIQPADIPFEEKPGTHYVQVTRTYPPRMEYPFAPNGDLGTLHTLRRAIQNAKRFIYLEDQYVFPYSGLYVPYSGPYPYERASDSYNPNADTVGLLNDLIDVLSRSDFEYLLILLEDLNIWPSLLQYQYRRRNFIRTLRDRFPGKIHTFSLYRGNTPIKVHSKVWIIDDVYAKIGSSNCNRRSLTHDSEVDIHVIDGALQNGGRAFARQLRMEMWGEYLNMYQSGKRKLLEDPSAALCYWLYPPKDSLIKVYDENDFVQFDIDDDFWNKLVDPDGRS